MSSGTSAWRERARRTAGGGIVDTWAVEAAGEPDHRRRFTDPDGCRDARVRSHKEGSMQQRKTSTKCAGIDVGKHWLDGAADGQAETVGVRRDAAGVDMLIAWLQGHGIERVGLEASGGYERMVIEALEA